MSNNKDNKVDASTIDKDGMLIHEKVSLKQFQHIEHGDLNSVHAIVVHQTGAPTAQHTFNAYLAGGNGAHFLIDMQGQIYQTASMTKRCYHVGALIKSKCLTLNKNNCDEKIMAKTLALSWGRRIKEINKNERIKSYPDRYPVNSDSIGIELVGKPIDKKTYEAINDFQSNSLQWLVSELYGHFSLASDDVYRHPEVSYKNPDEAASIVWK